MAAKRSPAGQRIQNRLSGKGYLTDHTTPARPTYEAQEKQFAADEKAHKQVNANIRGRFNRRTLRTVAGNEQSQGTKQMNAFIRNEDPPAADDPGQSPADLSEKEMAKLFSELLTAEKELEEMQKIPVPKGNAGSGTGTISAGQKRKISMNEKIRFIVDIRKKLGLG